MQNQQRENMSENSPGFNLGFLDHHYFDNVLCPMHQGWGRFSPNLRWEEIEERISRCASASIRVDIHDYEKTGVLEWLEENVHTPEDVTEITVHVNPMSLVPADIMDWLQNQIRPLEEINSRGDQEELQVAASAAWKTYRELLEKYDVW
tara:strand:- start:52 stop:498 length:447 start_codon:yes stop_codon:yes gene_type:complete